MLMVENLYWIALCLYHECRGEPQEGQIAVAHVIMNRAIKRGKSVKEIIQQPKQFSWLNDGRPDDVVDHDAFVLCMESVVLARNERLEGKNFFGADHYFADYIDQPSWAKNMTFIRKVGRHLFYRS